MRALRFHVRHANHMGRLFVMLIDLMFLDPEHKGPHSVTLSQHSAEFTLELEGK